MASLDCPRLKSSNIKGIISQRKRRMCEECKDKLFNKAVIIVGPFTTLQANGETIWREKRLRMKEDKAAYLTVFKYAFFFFHI